MQNGRLKGIPIGIDDFKDLLMSNGYFVDKSVFIKETIGDEFRRHKYILESGEIDEIEKEHFSEIKNEKAGYVRLSTSLKLLTKLLTVYVEYEVKSY